MQNTKIISVTWENLTASINGKAIIKNCSGYCKSGEMLAIMGPSGAGKTTLLSLISKRQSSKMRVDGQVLANKQAFTSQTFHKFGAFVYQNDLLFQCLTVKQTLEFAALLKIPNREAAKQKVKYLIEQFQLNKCENTYVGGPMVKGVSGGQKKRLCVAIQMVSDPSLIILDEPTSGLDSNKAARLLTILSKLAKNNHTVIFTIHQPSYLQFTKLDRLVLLEGGETVYQGPANQIQNYLMNLGIRVSRTSTISDFFMMEISQFKKGKSMEQTPFNHKNYCKLLGPSIESEIISIKDQHLTLNMFEDLYNASFLFSFKLIFKRDIVNIWRAGWKIYVTILQTVMKCLLVGMLFLNQIPSGQSLYNNPQAFLMFIQPQNTTFNTVGANFMPSLISVALTIPTQRQLYYKETDSKKYKPFPYFLSKVIIEFLLVLIGTLVFTSISYWTQGYTQTLDKFLNYVIISITIAAVGNSFGFFCSTLFKTMDRVSSLTNIVMIPLLILSGIFNKLTSMPEWSSWLQYVTPFRYGTHLYLQNQYGDQVFLFYDYKKDLGINFSYTNNYLALLVIGLFCYTSSYFLLKYYATKIAP